MAHSRIILYLVCLSPLAIGALSLLLGQDCNFDLKNYHLYNPYAVLNGRLSIDHNAAGIHTYLNPTLDLLTTYPLFKFTGPVGYALVMGMLHGINFVLLVLIALEVLSAQEPTNPRYRPHLAFLAAVMGMSGALTISEVGTCLGSLTTSILNLIAIYCAIQLAGHPGGANRIGQAVGCGMALGLAAGLKLTNACYALALLSVLPFFVSENRWKVTGLAMAAALTGVLLTHGWWSVWLWLHYDNPVFPFFNQFFKSRFFPADANFSDVLPFPKDWMQRLFYPFYFSWKPCTNPICFRDFRFPLGYICAILLAGKMLYVSVKKQERSVLSEPVGLLAVFMILGYVLWQIQFSIQRFAVTLELLLPVFILMTCIVVFRSSSRKIFVLACLFLAVTTRYPSWGRTDFDAPFYHVKDSELKHELQRSLVILGGDALSYLVPSLDSDKSVWLGDYYTSKDAEVALKKLQAKSEVPVYLICHPDGLAQAFSIAAGYGLSCCGEQKTLSSRIDSLVCIRLGSSND